VIIHGGDNGEMPQPEGSHEPKNHIFEMNFDEIQEAFKKTSYFLNSN